MAEVRIRAASVGMFGMLLVATGVFLGGGSVVGDIADPAGVLLWAIVIAVAHLLDVPTPSGHRINLGIGPAVAASILLAEPLDVAVAYSVGMALAWIVVQLRTSRLGRRDGDFLAETVAMAAYGLTFFWVLDAVTDDFQGGWEHLVSLAAAGTVWFLVRAIVSALVGLERADLSPRYLWLLALEDWTVVVALISAGGLFALSWPVLQLWAFPLALVPYGFSHVAFERYDSTRITYSQTIRALAQIPEVAGLAPIGHSYRTQDLAMAMAKELGLHPSEVTWLEYASMLHDVGRITLNEPAIIKAGYTDEDIARWGSQIVAEAPYLGHVSELVAQQYQPYRTPGTERDPDVPVASKIIKVASAYDQGVNEMGLSPIEALERIHQGSAYEYDPKIAASLRRVLVHRGIVAA